MIRSKPVAAAIVCLAVCGSTVVAAPPPAQKIAAQKLVEEIAARHPEVNGLELAAAPTQGRGCKTIAATKSKEIGEKCDKDELTAMKTNRPFVEHEKDGFDVTVPLHDASRAVIATLGIDFKPAPGQHKATVVRQSEQIAVEIERQITAKMQLFQPSK